MTVEQRRRLTRAELFTAIDAARPGLLRAKGRLVVDGQSSLVQVTPDSISIIAAEPGPTAVTLTAVAPSDAEPMMAVVGLPASSTPDND